MHQDETWHGGRPWPTPHCVWWAPNSSPTHKGHSPLISGHVHCGQTAGWIKMPHCTEVGLSGGDSVRWGPSSPYGKGHSRPPLSARVYCGQGRPCQQLLSSCTNGRPKMKMKTTYMYAQYGRPYAYRLIIHWCRSLHLAMYTPRGELIVLWFHHNCIMAPTSNVISFIMDTSFTMHCGSYFIYRVVRTNVPWFPLI